MENLQRGATQVASGEGKTLWVLGDLYEVKATGEDTGGRFGLWETTTPPGNPGPAPHIHHNEDEAMYVLEGECTVRPAYPGGSSNTSINDRK